MYIKRFLEASNCIIWPSQLSCINKFIHISQMDFQQASAFGKRCTVEGSTEYDVTRDSNLVIITAGAKQRPGQSRLDLLSINVKIMKSIVTEVLKYSPNAPICIGECTHINA